MGRPGRWSPHVPQPGDKFTYWIVLRAQEVYRDRPCVYCRCVCGKEQYVFRPALLGGKTKSCGCRRGQFVEKHGHNRGSKKLGARRSSEYGVWYAMIQRCTNKNAQGWKNYGGRGIRVCDRWRKSFADFLKDMGSRPRKHTISRDDNNGNYEPGNCRWVSRGDQARNTRRTVCVKFKGETKCLKDWANTIGISTTALRYRLKHWGVRKALSESGR